MPAVTPIRRPLDGLSPYDAEAVQQWALQRVAVEVLHHGRVAPRLILVLDDHVAEIQLDEATEGDPVATLHALADRGDIEQRILCGAVPSDAGWIAFVFGAGHDDERSWWMASTTFHVVPGGLGEGATSWEVVIGVELDEVPWPAAGLARGGAAFELLPAQPPALPRIQARVDDVPANAVVPSDAVAATNVVSELGHEHEAQKKGIVGMLVIVFREKTLERYHVDGEISVGIDDLVRNICGLGDEPKAVVTMSMGVERLGGENLRVVKMVSEGGGLRFQRLLALRWAQGDTEEPSHIQYFGSNPVPVVADGWIGVEPITELELFPLGAQT